MANQVRCVNVCIDGDPERTIRFFSNKKKIAQIYGLLHYAESAVAKMLVDCDDPFDVDYDTLLALDKKSCEKFDGVFGKGSSEIAFPEGDPFSGKRAGNSLPFDEVMKQIVAEIYA